ncbi:MAG: permease prefix domain 1-containing protein [Eubacteriales bacterium]|nr:permease prefix domain 1-containing protein [Eubacteriales bacterium]
METLKNYIETMFTTLPNTEQARKLKEEMLANMEERYQDLMAEGKTEAEAVGIIISSFGTVEELRATLAGEKKKKSGFGIHVEDKGGDSVHVDFSGIHADTAKEKISIDGNGVYVHTTDDDGNVVEHVVVDGSGVHVNGKDYDSWCFPHTKRQKISNLIGGILVPLAVAAYLVMGIVWNMWHPWWLLIPGTGLLVGSICALINAEGKPVIRVIEGFLWPAVILAYLCMGFFLGLWHPGWVIIPLAGILDGIANTLWNNLRSPEMKKEEE